MGEYRYILPDGKLPKPYTVPLYVTMGAKKGSLSVFYSLYRNIWRALNRIAGTSYKVKDSRGKERYSDFSYRNAEYLRCNIEEMLEEVPVNSIIIDDCDHPRDPRPREAEANRAVADII